jgi:hypothetical protein
VIAATVALAILGGATVIVEARALRSGVGVGSRCQPAKTPDREPPEPADAMQRRALEQLGSFTSWLASGGAEGFIGEVGWPGTDPRWNALAARWYEDADRAGLWVTAWAAGSLWEADPLVIYGRGEPGASAAPSASVVERHLGPAGVRRGVNINGGEFGIGPNLGRGAGGDFSNRNPGTYGTAYRYESAAMFGAMAERCLDLVRLPFRWERVQPAPGGELDPAEVQRITDALDRARLAGLDVIPTVMNYGAYWLHDEHSGRGLRHPIGSPAITIEDFTDLWRRLVDALGGAPNVVAWGLMNEPTDMPAGAAGWELASQAAVTVIRDSGDDRIVMVPGYDFSTVTHFWSRHPSGPWIHDPLGRIRYEAHHYFDHDGSGAYELTYDEELAHLP